MKKILFASSEVHPLIKTGGLADVSGALPQTLYRLGEDIRIILPAYPRVLASLDHVTQMSELSLLGQRVRLLSGHMPHTGLPVWLVAHPSFSERPGNPYVAPDGKDWEDNAWRFGLFCHAIAEIALNRARLDWQPEVVHCNDWQTGLVPALLALSPRRPASVFSVHNMAYQGIFPWAAFHQLGLPPQYWQPAALEYYGNLSFMKAGLVFADRISTVSPTYAREIQTPEFGYGLDGVLRERQQHLSGILNGIDTDIWNPADDPALPLAYDADTLDNKSSCKTFLQEEMGLPRRAEAPLFGFIGRLVEQKGIDWVMEVLPRLEDLEAQFVFLGSGEKRFQRQLQTWQESHPQRIAVRIGYDEHLAHRIEAGCDIFLMPSRFEPCGLNQMYSLRYGTPPLVKDTGGLADTVIDANRENLAAGTANGFVFREDDADAVEKTIRRAARLFASQPQTWRQIQQSGMGRDFSWEHSARQYQQLYQRALDDRPSQR